MVTINAKIAHVNGIPLGGIGTGSIEIWPDGYFHEWQIFNIGMWAPRQPGWRPKLQPSMDPAGLTFFLRTKEGDSIKTRRLGLRMDQHDMYSLPWLKSVQGIEYEGKFPVAQLKYADDTLPVAIQAEFFSPFLPHDAKTSGTPGFYAYFTVTNKSSKPVDVSLLGIMANPLAIDAKDRKLRNTIKTTGNTTTLTMRTGATKGFPATRGSLALSATGGDITWIGADFAQYFRGITMRPDHTHFSALHRFRASGKLPNLGNDLPCPGGAIKFLPKGKSALKKRLLLGDLVKYAFTSDFMDRYAEVGEKLEDPAIQNEFLMRVTSFLFSMFKNNQLQKSWGHGALCAAAMLQPGETRVIRYTLGWFFPNHYSKTGDLLGHAYENWFKNAEDVTEFLNTNADALKSKVNAFSETLFDTTTDPELADAWAAQLTTIPKCTWWIKDLNFGVWEGLGCCGFHTTDITYQGSFNLLALYPELQQRQMLMGAQFMTDDGRIPHFFTPDLYHVDHGFDRVDMNPQFVLLVCRDYLWTADKAYLQRIWPYIVRAMDNSQLLDTDGDGLPDHDTRRNTYDGWNFFGTPSYIASLWLGALRAAIRMAMDLDDRDHASAWQAVLDKAVPNFEKKLWNGEYFSLWIDDVNKKRDDMCMSDQNSGEWFSRIIGIGNSLPIDRVTAALRAVFKYNYSDENGLINGSYPPKRAPMFPAHYNMQALAPWTGVEYAIGSMMIDHGLVDEGKQVVKTIHERYIRAGRFWSHVECGDHYYRAMCSWAVLLAASGFKVDMPRQSIRVAPAETSTDVKYPWFSATAWGHSSWTGKKFVLACLSGKQSLKELRLNRKPPSASASIGDNKIGFTVAEDDGEFIVTFTSAIDLVEGTSLVV
nr:GH116 family glycosyl hydrolase [Candidatus Sigynarchaeota archaeon]